MDTAQHATPRCPVYLHPTAACNPNIVRNIQEASGQLVVITRGRIQLKPATPAGSFGPFGGDAA